MSELGPRGRERAPLVSSLIVPPDWRAVELLSDLHLSPLTPLTAAAFERYIDTTTADAVVVLGDLFEVWIGDDIGDDAFAQRCLKALHRSAQRRTTAVMVGNRDFLIGGSLLAGLGVIALDDPTVLAAWGRNIVLCHGDALCLDDKDYQAFRQQVRAQPWQDAFLARPRIERAAMARSMRDASDARKGSPVTTWADADAQATITLLCQHDAQVLVHGHTHRPASHQPAVAGAHTASVRHVLSDWDLDAEPHRADVLRITQSGIERITPPGLAGG